MSQNRDNYFFANGPFIPSTTVTTGGFFFFFLNDQAIQEGKKDERKVWNKWTQFGGGEFHLFCFPTESS